MLENKKILVTGANSGDRLAITKVFNKLGAHVIAIVRNIKNSDIKKLNDIKNEAKIRPRIETINLENDQEIKTNLIDLLKDYQKFMD